MSKESPTNETEKKLELIAPWLLATADDFRDFDFEGPIADSTSADCQELSDQFQAAVLAAEQGKQDPETREGRAYTLLSAITGMYFKPEDRKEPFGPMLTLTDGRRSAIPGDFQAHHLAILTDLAERAQHPVLRARLCDVCWVLDPKRGKIGSLALSAYVEIVNKVDRREFAFRFETETGALDHDARDYLRRALCIGWSIGWDKVEALSAREITITLRQRSVEQHALAPALWFSELDLDFGISNPHEVGTAIEGLLRTLPDPGHPHLVVELWRLAARAYSVAKRDDDKHRCLSDAAEHLVLEAESSMKGELSALLAAHTLANAIAQLHGIPDKKERRLELRHRLIDIQSRIPEEMSAFSYELDIREIAQKVEVAIRPACFREQLFIFIVLAKSPDPDDLISAARQMLHQHPLSSLFPTAHIDREGKVLHRSRGNSFGSTQDDSAVQNQIAQTESIRRQHVAFGKIEVARQEILEQHHIADEVLWALLQYSPFIEPGVGGTYCRGFTRFFQGDFISAIYILAPLLESSLRYVLKCYGHDVTIFDDATQTQEDRTISSLFEQMRNELDLIFTKSITTDIQNVFLAKTGPHIRHKVAHGLLYDAGPYSADAIYGCWLIFKLCMYPLIPDRHSLFFPFE
jgi:hypothetical protein